MWAILNMANGREVGPIVSGFFTVSMHCSAICSTWVLFRPGVPITMITLLTGAAADPIMAPAPQTDVPRMAPTALTLPGPNPILPGVGLPPAGAFVPVPPRQPPVPVQGTAIPVHVPGEEDLGNKYLVRRSKSEVRSNSSDFGLPTPNVGLSTSNYQPS